MVNPAGVPAPLGPGVAAHFARLGSGVAGNLKRHLGAEPAGSVQQIFSRRAEHVGYRTIAARLDAAGIPSPSASDPTRNPHRRQSGWSTAALQAIFTNPRYMGTETWGRVQKREVLLDPTNPAAGHVTRRKRRTDDGYVSVPDAIPAIVSPAEWALPCL